jgi:putative FmdB family regulatory protein
VPIYVFKCGCGQRFERLAPFESAPPGCPACGGETRKVPAGSSLGGLADSGLSRDRMPQTWRGTYGGDREYVTRMRRQWDARQRLEAKHPEIADDHRPILAHEGRYHAAPLRAGDPVMGGGPAATGHGHGHSHRHGPGGSPAEGGSSGSGPGEPG